MKDALCFHEPTEGIPFRLDSYYSGLHLLEKIYFLLREQERNGDVLAGKFLSLFSKEGLLAPTGASSWLLEIIKTLFEVKHDLEGRLSEQEKNRTTFVQIDISSLPEKDRSSIVGVIQKIYGEKNTL